MLIVKDEHTEMTNMEEEETEESCIRLPPRSNMGTSSFLSEFESCPRGSTYPDTNKVLCVGCQRPIYDKFYMWVDQRTWHESCVQCSVCRQKLEESCYIKNYRLYCYNDYKQLQHCWRCSRAISSEQYVQRVGGQTFHVPCFSCDFCQRQLTSGEKCLMGNDCHQISCTSCYKRADSELFTDALGYSSGSNSDVSDNEVFMEPGFATSRYPSGQRSGPYSMTYGKDSIPSSSSEGKRSKRPRTILTTAQRRKFKASFEVSQKPCRKVRETLAAETGLTPRVVQVWFQNQRAKMKKLARRQTQDDSISPRGGSRCRRTRTGDSDSENEESSPGSYTSMSTPHHLSLYQDTYRSPGSIQTSPTTSISEHNLYSASNISYLGESKDHPVFDDSEMRMPNESRFISHHQGPPIASTSHINGDQSRLQINVRPHLNDFNNNSRVDVDIPMVSPNDEFQPYLSEPRGGGASFSQHTAEINPLDRLMYMQDNFFQSS